MLLALLLSLNAPPVQARCPELYDRIGMDAREKLGEALSCEDVKNAASLLPFEGDSSSAWTFTGEKALRETLRGLGVEVPAQILPLGFVERRAPAGSTSLVVFGLHAPDRLALLAALSRMEGPVDKADLAPILGKGVWYDRVIFFSKEEGEAGYKPGQRWLTFRRGGLWGRHQAVQRSLRGCPPCRGWLCPREPWVCFSDFNEDGPEEMHLTDDCRDGLCGMAVFDPDGKGGARLMFNATLRPAAWEERPEGWMLVQQPRCKGAVFCTVKGRSLGDPTCERPTVYLLRRGSRNIEGSVALTDEYFPIARKKAPKGCDMQAETALVWSQSAGFVLYERE
ncbi:MAG: hypothetical protein WC728_15670 [Elusimicrobiota bacterium]